MKKMQGLYDQIHAITNTINENHEYIRDDGVSVIIALCEDDVITVSMAARNPVVVYLLTRMIGDKVKNEMVTE